MLRCAEMGLSMTDLDLLTFGLVMDMFTEKSNDSFEYGDSGEERQATQDDFDNY